MRTDVKNRLHDGFSILEVMIGIFIFAVGMLALSSLQGALTRSMADAKVRTTAANIAERTIENSRGFTELVSDTAVPPTFIAYNDIADETVNETVNGITYTVTTDVTDHYYDVATDGFTTTAPSGAVASTYKQVEVTVSWNAAQNFRGAEGTEISAADLGSGEVVVTATIPALVTSAAAQVSDQTDSGDSATPPVSYQPGLNPDIVSLSLGDNKFKESLLPEPDVIRAEELVETRFDVITYSQTGEGSFFLRREEFATVSCECTLQAPDSDNPGHRPVIWAGDEYVRGQHAVKPYGVAPANIQQSPLCDSCCRDHHDGGTVVAGQIADHTGDSKVNTYVPFKPSTEFVTSGTFAGDHKHYTRPRVGDPVEVTTAGSNYLEACRLVRRDGFFRVAQDFRREDLNIFPSDFLDDTNEVNFYSTYATGAATAYAAATSAGYEADPPCIGPSPCVVPSAPKQGDYDAAIALDVDGNPTEFPSWTTLPINLQDTQQLRSRGIYLDYLSADIRSVLSVCDPDTETASDDDCKSGDVELDQTGSVNHLEMLPFFDVQMTRLNRWNETPIAIPVETTNEPLADGNTHSRGVISKTADGHSTVMAIGHRGNLGFTDTLPIDPGYELQLTGSDIYVYAGADVEPPAGLQFSGTLTETVPGNPSIIVTGLHDVVCDQTSASYTCIILAGAVNPQIQLSGYGKQNFYRYACSTSSPPLGGDPAVTVTNGENAKAVFDLDDVAAGSGYNFVIQAVVCPIVIPIPIPIEP